MRTDILSEIDKDKFRRKLSMYTRQAYSRLPHIPSPSILDIGCGSGIPTVQLAIISKGKVIAVDIDRKALQKLKEKIKILHLSGHITPVRRSLHKLRFKNNTFDIIWAEGSVTDIGFEKALKKWRRFIKTGGFLVIHDEINDYKKKITRIPEYHFTLIHHFIIQERVWLKEYFIPLKQRIIELQAHYKNKQGIMKILKQEEEEINLFTKTPEKLASLFYIMQKTENKQQTT
jgi:ubiquinone/menaquinone biosynthesis C-methylase UbiE